MRFVSFHIATARVCAAMLVAAWCASAHAVDRLVPAEFPTIQLAIDAAAPGDVILVSPGSYNESLTLDLSLTLKSVNGAEATIISALGLDQRVVTISGVGDPGARIDGFTLRDGATASGGAGLRIAGSIVTIAECIIAGNVEASTAGGAGMWVSNSTVTLERCIVRGNIANGFGQGAGIRLMTDSALVAIECTIASNLGFANGVGLAVGPDSTGHFTACVFEANTTLGSIGLGGGAYVSEQAGAVEFIDCFFTLNSAPAGSGAAVFAAESPGSFFSNCAFTTNVATSSALGGAGLLVAGEAVVSECVFAANDAMRGAGVTIAPGPGFRLLFDCFFQANEASQSGAAVYCRPFGSATLAECRMLENRAAERGAGAFVDADGSLEFDACLFSSNMALEGAGVTVNAGGSASITDSDFTSNTADLGAALHSFAPHALSVSGGMFTGNHAFIAGGAVHYGGDSTLVIANVTFDGNTTDGHGAALALADAQASCTMSDADVRNNTALIAGGAILIPAKAALDLAGSEFCGNSPNHIEGSYLDGGGNLFGIACPIGDVTGDGLVDLADLIDVINTWGPCPVRAASCPADLTGDGYVGIADLLAVLGNWT